MGPDNGDKLKYMPFFGTEFYEDDKVAVFQGYAEHGFYLKLLWHQWRHRVIPSDDQLIRCIVKPGPQEAGAWDYFMRSIDETFPVCDDEMYRQNAKLEEVRQRSLDAIAGKSKGGRVGGLRSAETRRRMAGKDTSSIPSSIPLRSVQQGEGGGVIPSPPPSPPTQKKKESANKSRDTWLTPYGDDWIAAYQGQPNWGQLAKEFSKVHDKLGEAYVRPRWQIYLAKTPAEFANPSRFVSTIGSASWDPAKQEPPAHGFGDDDFHSRSK